MQGAEALALALELVSVAGLSGVTVEHDLRIDPGICLTFVTSRGVSWSDPVDIVIVCTAVYEQQAQ